MPGIVVERTGAVHDGAGDRVDRGARIAAEEFDLLQHEVVRAHDGVRRRCVGRHRQGHLVALEDVGDDLAEAGHAAGIALAVTVVVGEGPEHAGGVRPIDEIEVVEEHVAVLLGPAVEGREHEVLVVDAVVEVRVDQGLRRIPLARGQQHVVDVHRTGIVLTGLKIDRHDRRGDRVVGCVCEEFTGNPFLHGHVGIVTLENPTLAQGDHGAGGVLELHLDAAPAPVSNLVARRGQREGADPVDRPADHGDVVDRHRAIAVEGGAEAAEHLQRPTGLKGEFAVAAGLAERGVGLGDRTFEPWVFKQVRAVRVVGKRTAGGNEGCGDEAEREGSNGHGSSPVVKNEKSEPGRKVGPRCPSRAKSSARERS